MGCRHVDAGAGVFDEKNTKTRSAQIAGHIKTTDVRGNATHDDGSNAARTQELRKGGMLRRQRVRFKITIVTLAPDGVKALGAQARKEVRARRVHNTVRRIEIIALAEETTMIGWMPILTGIDARPRHFQQTIDIR